MGRVLAVLFGMAFAIAGVVFLGWILWQLWKRHEEEAAPAAIEIKAEAEPLVTALATEEEEETAAPSAEPEAPKPKKAPRPDDLKRIEGIGPKIASVLQAAGIATFAQLAATEASQIEQILEEADPRLRRLADPTTWPEQADVAASGDWDALKALQNELKAGRRA